MDSSSVLSWFTSGESPIGLLMIGFGVGIILGKFLRKPPPIIAELRYKLSTEKQEREKTEALLVSNNKTLRKAESAVKNFDAVREALFGEENELWKLYPASPPTDYAQKLAHSKPKIVMIANMKGGVGKTTLVANLAAYFEKNLGKRVLLIDLDYQGSLSETLLRMVKMDFSGSLIDDFISGKKDGEELLKIVKPLNAELPNTFLLPSNYNLYQLENRLMLQWLLQETKSDIRFNLGKVLLHPAVQDRFDIIMIDGPPRLSTGAINALSCCHHIIIPTVPDSMAVPAVGRFLEQVGALRPELNPALRFSGVVLNQTSGVSITGREEDSLARLHADFAKLQINGHIYEQHIPHLGPLANMAGKNVLYLRNKAFREGVMDKLGAEVAKSIGFGVLK